MTPGTYNFTCSSDACSSGSGGSDYLNDMTLHPPNGSVMVDQLILSSIREWETGSSRSALVNCKERFPEEPTHTDFISEVDNGQSIVRCNGWRTPNQQKFRHTPPFILLDIPSTFRQSITSLDYIPLKINASGHNYNLGGVSSYIASRSHYTGYLVVEGEFLSYDGLPYTHLS